MDARRDEGDLQVHRRNALPVVDDLYRGERWRRPEALPLGYAERIAIDPESGKYAFTRKSWDNATWKRYRGGTAPDIWVGDPKKADYKKVTDFDGINAYPMWHHGRIYFLSDPAAR
jgi:tricorn protease